MSQNTAVVLWAASFIQRFHQLVNWGKGFGHCFTANSLSDATWARTCSVKITRPRDGPPSHCSPRKISQKTTEQNFIIPPGEQEVVQGQRKNVSNFGSRSLSLKLLERALTLPEGSALQWTSQLLNVAIFVIEKSKVCTTEETSQQEEWLVNRDFISRLQLQ